MLYWHTTGSEDECIPEDLRRRCVSGTKADALACRVISQAPG